LVQIGALDSIAGCYTRPQLFWIYSHFEDTQSVPACIKDYPAARKLRDEYESSGLIFSRHPLEVFLPRVAHYLHPDAPPQVDSQTIAEYCGMIVRIAGFLVAEKEIRTTTQQTMSFVSFEDQYGVFETVLFPTVYRRMVEQLENGVAFLLEGKIEYEWGTLQLNVTRLFPLTRQDKALTV
jgi:DNA polymerase III alpha subunit